LAPSAAAAILAMMAKTAITAIRVTLVQQAKLAFRAK
jgi:hypothetical protein